MTELHESARPWCVPAAGGAPACSARTPRHLHARASGVPFPARASLLVALLPLLAALALVTPAQAASLKGTKAAMQHQYAVARLNNFEFARTAADVRRAVDEGVLVRAPGNTDYELDKVSYPYCRPEVKTFIERLARGYHAATGEKLVITSLTRPTSQQPRNASDLSVHPAGMAMDIRRSNSGSAQRWLERELLSLERQGVIDATKERRPPHYHVAVFPGAQPNLLAEAEPASATPPAVSQAAPTKPAKPVKAKASYRTHKVRRGDSLWTISQRYDCTVKELKRANSMASSRLRPGQVLRIPAR